MTFYSGPVPYLASVVFAPGPHRAIALERQAMVRSGNGPDSAQVLHLHRRVTVGSSPIAELAVVVPAPGPHSAVVLERQVIGRFGGDGLEPAEVLYLHRR